MRSAKSRRAPNSAASVESAPSTGRTPSAREVADHQAFARALEPAHELADADARPAGAVRARHREILVGIDGEAARLHLVDALAPDQLAELFGLALLIGHAGKAEQVDGG